MEVAARHLGGSKFEVTARSHRIVCDQPEENSGTDEGMTPPEFMLASLATCAGYYAAQYLKVRSLTTDLLTVHVNAEKAKQPARLGSFQIDVTAPGLDERQQEGLLRAVKACLIHNTLLGLPEINVTVNPCGSVPASAGSRELLARSI